MDKKNKIFFIVVFLLLFGSVGATYLRIVVFKNYIVEAQADCDPETEKCFVWECDPASAVEGEACSGDDIENSKNSLMCFGIKNCFDCKYCNEDGGRLSQLSSTAS